MVTREHMRMSKTPGSRDRLRLISPTLRSAVVGVVLLGVAATSYGAGPDVVRIRGDQAKTLLGDGTNVIVAVVDSGVDDTHPQLSGLDSLGRPRMLAEANFVTTEPANTGDDTHGHGTAVMGVIGLRDSSNVTIGTDTRFINARVLDSSNSFNTQDWVIDGAGFSVAQGADVINMSLGYFNSDTSGRSTLSMMADSIAFNRRKSIVISAGNAGNSGNVRPQGPGDAFNVISLGNVSTTNNYGRINSSSSYGPTTDGRSKPDLAAPGTNILTANAFWESGSTQNSWTGTSFAAPNTSGLIAGQIEAGRRWGYSIDPLVIKSTIQNSAARVNRRDGSAWAQSVSGLNVFTGLDRDSGTGIIDGVDLYEQYVPGDINALGPNTLIDPTGWDLSTVTNASSRSYFLGQLPQGASVTATLNWYRKVGYNDVNNNGVIDAADNFPFSGSIANLDLELVLNGGVYARSISNVNSTEHLRLSGLPAGAYTLVVRSASSVVEEYALAWDATVLTGDFTGDALRTPSDIELLLRATPGTLPTGRALFDLNDDYVVNRSPDVSGSDADFWVRSLMQTQYGDTNLDRRIDFLDLLALARNYSMAGDKTWLEGSFNGDGVVGFADLLTMARNYGFGTSNLSPADFESDWTLARATVPEPGTLLVGMAGLAMSLRRRSSTRRRPNA